MRPESRHVRCNDPARHAECEKEQVKRIVASVDGADCLVHDLERANPCHTCNKSDEERAPEPGDDHQFGDEGKHSAEPYRPYERKDQPDAAHAAPTIAT